MAVMRWRTIAEVVSRNVVDFVSWRAARHDAGARALIAFQPRHTVVILCDPPMPVRQTTPAEPLRNLCTRYSYPNSLTKCIKPQPSDSARFSERRVTKIRRHRTVSQSPMHAVHCFCGVQPVAPLLTRELGSAG